MALIPEYPGRSIWGLFRSLGRPVYDRLPPRRRLRVRAKVHELRGHPGIGDPTRIYHVDPNAIVYSVYGTILDFDPPELGIVGGDWDLQAKRLTGETMYHLHFRDGIPWEDTEKYHEICERLADRGTYGHLDLPPEEQTIEAWDTYLEYLDDVYEDIEENGYKSQLELSPEDDFAGRKQAPLLAEIQVFIGRDGRVIVFSGRHRLYIAQCLELDTIPVRTQVRHPQWQAIRDQIVSSDSVEEIADSIVGGLDHPELQDLL